ncbi:MAG: hypothetical protein J7L43_02380, partial [Candidatus Aenigmarchaeota archaeon]|nr:hypothetical protein [Candidatus Aenigmarchaeota archaeon]
MKLEEMIVEEIYEKMKNGLLGRTKEYNRIVNNEPDSMIFVGKLQPIKRANGRYTQYRTIINPNSIGMDFDLVTRDSDSTINITVNFSIYYRVYPSLEEQKNAVGKDVIKVWKKERIEIILSCKVRKGSHNFKEKIRNKIEEVINDPRKPYYEMVYRAKGRADLIPKKHLRSEEDFIKYLRSRNGRIYDIPYDIDLKVNFIEKGDRKFNIKILLTNNTSGKSPAFCTTIFDPEIKIELGNNELKRRKLEFMHDDEGKMFGIPGKGINCSIEYNEKDNIIKTTVIPTYKQKRLKPRTSAGKWIPHFDKLSVNPIPILYGIHSE